LAFAGLGQQKGNAVIEMASKDVGIFEGKSNTGATQKFVKFWNEKYPKSKLSLQSPYCGLAVWYWYYKAGLNPQISFSPRAINWKIHCKHPVSFFGLTLKDLEEIPTASAVVFGNNWGNHVGTFKEAEGSFIYTYEGNTSTLRSVEKYNFKKEGVFLLKTSVNNRQLRPLYFCDCVKQSVAL
jgi:hypothetical protein